ncbi:hypothetical protein [Desulforamulus ruminis]|uniref:Uncharacterized protein n=1 Tax=Desulforamulus ruminis (strain ATCC 23193 / DSM 2154 / NCIMB 8452 / DL) TaxID=696281 RepID=F6DM34_DESRL|nr:hypothetical protein [Desulforamulus ruminis]AEG59376.1 hypothetical protein Desru_1101 [Desulforamulus ruminis DSM 2154]
MAYTPLTRDQYIQQQNEYAQKTYQNQYDAQKTALQQAYDRNRLGFDSSRTSIQNAYTQGGNRLNELRDQAQADYSAGANSINEQKAAQTPLYQQSRNAASVNAAQSARKLSELMAAKGLSRGGSFLSGQAGIQNQRAAEIGDVNRQEGLFNAQMANRLAELEQARANSLGAIGNRSAELEQTYMGDLNNLTKQEQLYGQQYSDSQRALQEALANQIAAAGLQAPLQYEDYYNQQLQNSLALAGFAWGNLSDYAAQTGNFGMPKDYKPGDFLNQFYNQWYK